MVSRDLSIPISSDISAVDESFNATMNCKYELSSHKLKELHNGNIRSHKRHDNMSEFTTSFTALMSVHCCVTLPCPATWPSVDRPKQQSHSVIQTSA